jgi:hypothetical protein
MRRIEEEVKDDTPYWLIGGGSLVLTRRSRYT